MKVQSRLWAGHMVALPVKQAKTDVFLDGFWRHDKKPAETLVVFVHGMHSNFYRSALKKMLMEECAVHGLDWLAFNNRGAEGNVTDERFEHCLADIQAALDFGRAQGYRRFVLVGHSTGCQKIVYYQALRKNPLVKGLVLLAPGDDYAIARRDAGARFSFWVNKARQYVRDGRGDELLPSWPCLGFTARRYLSIADPKQTESKIFNYEGPLHHFRQVRCPILLLFGGAEEYACLPVPVMHEILREKTRAVRFDEAVIPGADHGFHDHAREVADIMTRWIGNLP